MRDKFLNYALKTINSKNYKTKKYVKITRVH